MDMPEQNPYLAWRLGDLLLQINDCQYELAISTQRVEEGYRGQFYESDAKRNKDQLRMMYQAVNCIHEQLLGTAQFRATDQACGVARG